MPGACAGLGMSVACVPLQEFQTFVEEHPKVLEVVGVSQESALTKARLLALLSLASRSHELSYASIRVRTACPHAPACWVGAARPACSRVFTLVGDEPRQATCAECDRRNSTGSRCVGATRVSMRERGSWLTQEALDIDEGQEEAWVIRTIGRKLLEARIDQMRRVVTVSRLAHRAFTHAQWGELRAQLAAWKENVWSVKDLVGAQKDDGLSRGLPAAPVALRA